MSKIFVIAGTKAEAEYWIRDNLEKRSKAGETTLSRSEYIYVDDVVRIRGYSNPHGVFVGRWRERANIEEIVDVLLISSTNINPLARIRQEIKMKSIKPTPKIKHARI